MYVRYGGVGVPRTKQTTAFCCCIAEAMPSWRLPEKNIAYTNQENKLTGQRYKRVWKESRVEDSVKGRAKQSNNDDVGAIGPTDRRPSADPTTTSELLQPFFIFSSSDILSYLTSPHHPSTVHSQNQTHHTSESALIS